MRNIYKPLPTPKVETPADKVMEEIAKHRDPSRPYDLSFKKNVKILLKNKL